MTRSNSLSTYTDVKIQLEQIRAQGGALMEFTTFGGAVSWVARVYTYRKLLRDQALANAPPGLDPGTPWDDLIVRHDKQNKAAFVTVQFGVLKRGNMKPLPTGLEKPLTLVTGLEPAPVVVDDLLEAAMAEVEKQGEKK